MKLLLALVGWCLSLLIAMPSWADEIKLAVTTSFHNSGLADELLPEIKKDLNLTVHLLVVGTGQALKLGRSGDVDAILVHSKKAEEKFVADGFGCYRRELMYNDFVLAGPKNDPGKIARLSKAVDALKVIEKNKHLFASRGDDSGTHKKEISLWRSAGLNPFEFDSVWYRSAGSGMGATLNIANAMNAYVLTDRATWLNFKNRDGLKLMLQGDKALHNQYTFIPVCIKKHPHVKRELVAKVEQWLAGEKGQGIIGAYKLAGEQLFFPNANNKNLN
ncbi:sulfate ABC transporter substrate-binding protein [Sneathiella sp. P13V-1]|uniref:substrate-binding domain-containing protein n=1 Tax=Sneathiella sp. P13V-1 TaxID=2697366 RepID=UPI00187BA92A|nr:substrate-binding domain-containing protein [Sneathiella sp. P13V-1]MBE7636633.1 sulfate ABC transporter substrate-binding protein [Sneathiella sp. P13V-1]